MNEYFLSLKGICKSFPGVKALDNIDLDIKPGETHALVGENGAGKSTLIKILTGAYQYDEGEMYCQGKQVRFASPKDAYALGIACIYQELSLATNMTVTENIFLGRELRIPGVGLLDYSKMNGIAQQVIDDLGIEVNVKDLAQSYSMGYRQMIEIARALVANAKLIIMDEPTSSLSGKEVKCLLEKIHKLKEKGIAVVYISHHLEEVMEIADRITILRDGCKIKVMDKQDTNQDDMIHLMVGRVLGEKFPKVSVTLGNVALKVEGINRAGVLDNVSFEVRSGEVLGFSGLVGAGRTELARAIFGADKIDSGKIFINGQEVKIDSPKDAIQHGMAFLTEDRKGQGLVLMHNIRFNASLSGLKRFCRLGLINTNVMNREVDNLIEQLQLRPGNPLLTTRLLSGGNQQKVVIAKWLCSQSKIFIFDEPTRGIDVGAKVEVYKLINRLALEGVAVIVISSELPEVMGISDRILVMYEGRITAEFNHSDVTPTQIMKAATGGMINEHK
ncbi:ribose transport system ATP-binding protein [Sporomusaceae bacterium BoRhaA]|uniref:sugar ABC transporter ATP-binding protein n=1 Tax=Pelorhabdus rhamnosifermentans TaxID=2772457 RepID=UPI001C064843|nr:sugar ABC transporter ATP-binding protein [Pelorhabdus rhamnosifermentans]MBU2701772.1 ribose transport system ATP-binding protein [Pelorhabdus rhamnosifermentans]